MIATDVIGYTADGAAYCTAHKPTCDCLSTDPSHIEPTPVFESDRGSWEDGGLSCDRCGVEIVESDTCRTCDRSLRDDHDEYRYGRPDRPTVVRDLCRPHGEATIRVRTAIWGASWATTEAHCEIVPFDGDDPAAALDEITSAYGRHHPADSRILATFDLVESELVPS